MPHTKETSLPTAEQLDMERRRLRYKRRYNRTLRSTVAILIVVAALARSGGDALDAGAARIWKFHGADAS